MIEPPYYPIIYLRGYAGTQGEVEDTVSTPYMGFNLGSTRIRQVYTGKVHPHVFESPVIRLMKDHGYVDAYHDGRTLPHGPVPSRSIWIFRYYDVVDEELGDGSRREIEYHARRLSEFLRHVRDAVQGPNDVPEKHQRNFRAYLVAHSMGGLICRCYLQNPEIPDIDCNTDEAKRDSYKGVDKVFTYGTPHGGIEFRSGLGWAEGLRDFVDPNNAGNFGPRRMREFLALPFDADLKSLNGWFPAERVFCLVGTDARDYGAAGGLSRRAVGPLSDGLVQIKNASVVGAPRAYVYRSHSGYYGLVNSESGYQNLRRFLFGDSRVLVEMTDVAITLPPDVEKEKQNGKKIRASYHIDTIVSVRGVAVELHRRTVDEESAVLRSYEKLTKGPTKLFTAFLLQSGRVNSHRTSLGFALRLQVRVPENEIDGFLFLDDHYEGGTLFADKLNIEATPGDEGGSQIRYGWDRSTPNRSSDSVALHPDGDALTGEIPFTSGDVHPGICGNLRLTITSWNSPSAEQP